MSNPHVDSRPLIGFDGERATRFEWEEFDAIMAGATVSYQRREVTRDGRHERIIKTGALTDGRRYRSREFYSI